MGRSDLVVCGSWIFVTPDLSALLCCDWCLGGGRFVVEAGNQAGDRGPAVLLLVMEQDFMFSRYFVISVAFGLVATACELGNLFHRRRPAKVCVIVLVVMYLVGNVINVANLYSFGRDDCRGAVLCMADRTPGWDIRVTSDNDFRNGILLKYYQRHLSSNKDMFCFLKAERTVPAPDWLIRHGLEPMGEVANSVPHHGVVYEHEKTFRFPACTGLFTRGRGWIDDASLADNLCGISTVSDGAAGVLACDPRGIYLG